MSFLKALQDRCRVLIYLISLTFAFKCLYYSVLSVKSEIFFGRGGVILAGLYCQESNRLERLPHKSLPEYEASSSLAAHRVETAGLAPN